LARQVGTILEGAYFQPVQSTDLETVLEGDTVLEWVTVAADSEYAGQTLAESDVRGKTGVSVIAIQRDDRTIANPGADTVLKAGDTIVALGPRDACRSFRQEIGGELGVD
jgi:TrkA domain protein